MLDPRKVDEFKRYFAEMTILVKGELDAEYKKVKDALTELDNRNASVDALNAQKQDLAKNAAELQKTHSTWDDKLQKWEAELQAREKALADKLKAHTAASADLTAAKSAHTTWANSEREAIDGIRRDLAIKEAQLKKLENDVRNRETDVAVKEEQIKKAMSILTPVKA